jgi:hypothetical protein
MNIQSDTVLYFFSVEAQTRSTAEAVKIQGVISCLPINQDSFTDFKKIIEDDYYVYDVEFISLNRL